MEPSAVATRAYLLVFARGGGVDLNVVSHLSAAEGPLILASAARLFNERGDKLMARREGRKAAPGPGVIMGGEGQPSVELETGDVAMCVTLDDDRWPVVELGWGAEPTPAHLWAAATLCEVMLRTSIGTNLMRQQAALAQMAEGHQNGGRGNGSPGKPGLWVPPA